MNWEEIVDKQTKDYQNHLNGYHQSLEQLNADKALVIGEKNEADLPDNVHNKLARDQDSWKNEWGMYGKRFKDMRVTHQKEIDNYFARQSLIKSLNNDHDNKDKSKEHSGGR